MAPRAGEPVKLGLLYHRQAYAILFDPQLSSAQPSVSCYECRLELWTSLIQVTGGTVQLAHFIALHLDSWNASGPTVIRAAKEGNIMCWSGEW